MSLILDGTTGVPVTTVTGTLPVANGGTGGSTSTGTGAVVLTTSPTISAPTLSGPTISAPVLSGTATGTYTLGGTPTITAPTISAPVLSGTTTGTYTLGGTPTISSPTLVTPALGTPASGTLTNCTGVAAAALPAGSVLQVVSTTKTDVFTTTSTSFVDVTGLSVSITPSSASNKILVLVQVNGSQDVAVNRTYLKLLRDSTAINMGDAAGSRIRGFGGFSAADHSIASCPVSGMFLDSPATTSSTTYKLQVVLAAGSGTCFINRTDLDGDEVGQIRTASTITVMEIKA